EGIRGDARRDPDRARGLLRGGPRPRRSHGRRLRHRQARPGPAAPRSGITRPRIARAGDDAQRCGRAPRGRDGDRAQHGVSFGERIVKRWTILLCTLALPLAGRSASLTIGRLHYDGGGDWYTGPSKLVNLLGAIRQRTRL